MLNDAKMTGAGNLQMPRVVLHVGMPKTATSSFYSFLKANRPELQKRGIVYPALRTPRGKPLSLNDAVWLLSSGRPGERDKARAAIDDALKSARESGLFFLGAENITKYARADDGVSHDLGARHIVRLMHAGDDGYWVRREQYLSDLAEILGSHPVELWIVLRRRDRFAESIYRQALLNRNYIGTVSDLVSSSFALLDYERILGQYARYFPVKLFIYEDLVEQGEGDAVASLARELNLGDLVDRRGNSHRINVGYNPEVLEFIRRLNHFPVPQKQDMVRRLVKWSARESKSFVGVSLLSPDERRDLVERFRESDRRVLESFQLKLARENLFPHEGLDKGKKYEGMTRERFRYICHQIFPDVIGAA